ncbi:hypothetical protein [Deinococcus radiodurans]|uniref:hypothetical protein n=1 Tax=Deinococcus radiodurans TaxID=1299 RepID=UPI0004892B9D|nr:hypothetical protein [Deinococcus radiodurans]ANC70765.1 hypothetical protein A2G07_02735 [Deinococcus radiodurans R1 = ATCC 13939 = DSM 20539]QEM71562.1 hypothetical protein DXG80_07150 [Deinococcus radiodurans]QIP27876.1 hypothetical protein HAV23_00515 [Deinococcus radiodurans]QIP31244.1 hypothetical protein HAV35_03000 [Deinococcus radiodurans]UDL01205.1 hypothetical protein E5E91_11225 [Deinococcus radiodurans R1 = ATCC 13939 = DSM 20539]
MHKTLTALLSVLVLSAAAAQTTAPKQTTPTPAQAQKATAVTQENARKAQAKKTNNLSRYQRTECARKHGNIVKNPQGKLVCIVPKPKK